MASAAAIDVRVSAPNVLAHTPARSSGNNRPVSTPAKPGPAADRLAQRAAGALGFFDQAQRSPHGSACEAQDHAIPAVKRHSTLVLSLHHVHPLLRPYQFAIEPQLGALLGACISWK